MTEAPSKPFPLLYERYRVEALLGESRLSAVYRAIDERLRRVVLVHLLRKELIAAPALRQRFLEESQASARRSHPALLEVYDSGELNGRPFLITEYIDGRPLRALAPLLPQDALLFLRQVVGAVETCQQLGLPHPPISSSNILLTEPGRVRLVESWGEHSEQRALELAHYRAPERARGERPTAASTVYALGVLLVELLSGQRPFQGESPAAIASAQLAQPVPSLHTLRPSLYAPSLDAVIARATAVEPTARYPHAAALGQALDALRDQLHDETRPLTPPQRRPAAVAEAPARSPTQTQPDMRPPEAAPRARRPQAPLQRSGKPSEWGRALRVWLVLGLLIAAVAGGGFWLANSLSRWIERAEVPALPAPELPGLDWRAEARERLPEWLRWVVPVGPSQFVVNVAGLNLRPEPGTNNTPLAELPNGTRLALIEGPVALDDGSQWVRVRSEADGLEGWVNLEFLKAE
jgi:eukaryotic-like serine/threonine-protein kinase